MFTITIVGLGLMGGSIAMAAAGFQSARILAVDKDAATLHKARQDGVIADGSEDPGLIRGADLVVLCLNPTDALDFLKAHAHLFKPGSVLTDITGVKVPLLEAASVLPAGVDYVGGHPMAGRECWGYANADKNLFHGANYILLPGSAAEKSVQLVRDLALHMGAGRIVFTDAKTHDRNIAYTSQLMHVLASALVQSGDLDGCRGFEGNSFRDCTRVAFLNPAMWSSLFTLNAAYLTPAIVRLEQSLAALRKRIASGDEEAVRAALEESAKRKETWGNA